MCDAEGLLDDPMEVAEMMKRVFLLQASRFAVVIAAGEGGEATPTQTVVGYLVAQRKAVDTVAISLLEKL
jgi:aspartate carbamoyltransferase catalytic subunit